MALTADAIAEVNTVTQAMQFCRIGDVGVAGGDARALMDLMGLDADTPMEDVGYIPAVTFQATVTLWRYGDPEVAASPLYRGMRQSLDAWAE